MKPQFDPWCATFALLWYGPESEIVVRIDNARAARCMPSFLEGA